MDLEIKNKITEDLREHFGEIDYMSKGLIKLDKYPDNEEQQLRLVLQRHGGHLINIKAETLEEKTLVLMCFKTLLENQKGRHEAKAEELAKALHEGWDPYEPVKAPEDAEEEKQWPRKN